MSQDEVLRCLHNLGGSAWHDDLADAYNKTHFPRNLNYKDLPINDVKKTLQGDLSKLLRDNLIARDYKVNPKRRIKKYMSRKEGYYSITPFGLDYITRYKIVTTIAH